MSKREPLAGYFMFQSMDMSRCQLLLSDTVYDPSNVQLLEQGGGNWGKPNTATLLINFAGRSLVARSGSIKFDSFGADQATGRYELVGVDSATGESVELSGPMDFCDYGRNPACPHQSSGIDALPKKVGWTGPDGFSADQATSRANECRVLIDKKTSSVRVDMQAAVVNGLNIARWRDRCGPSTPVTAGFRFMAVNVSGPGSYGPFTSKPVNVAGGDPGFLPGFHLEAPTLYWLGNCLSAPDNLFDIQPSNATSCSFTIAENPGKFHIECTNADHKEAQTFYSKTGSFDLTSDCDVRYVN